MSRIVALPNLARGKFRLTAAELRDLWDFTLRQTQQHADQILADLSEMSRTSPFEDTMSMAVERISDSFWQHLDARPRKDVATVATHILSTLLGVESVEETDEALIIEPFFSEVDAHLVFWDSMF